MIQLTRKPIEMAKLDHDAVLEDCGALLTFSGNVRNHHKGRQVLKLEYEGFEPMAFKELESLVDEARSRWSGIQLIQVVHRLGTIEIGESSLYITISSHHRQASLEAMAFILNRLKQDVPIWKKEYYLEGDSGWIHPTE